MSIELRPIMIETGSADEVGRLVLLDNRLVALLVQLEELHMELSGTWSLEWIAGSSLVPHLPFRDLEAAKDWLGKHLMMRSS